MKNKHLAILSATLLTVIVSISCNGVSRPVVPLEFEPDTLPYAQIGTLYETEIYVSQNDTAVAHFQIINGALPAGLKLVEGEEANTAKINGMPEEAGAFIFTVSVWCYPQRFHQGQSGEKEYKIVVEK
jgi:hypothetical protein